MLRKIQLSATIVATILSVGALFDLIMERAGKLTLDHTASNNFPLAGMPFTPDISGTLTILLGAILVTAAVLAQWSVTVSCRASRAGDIACVNRWRRLTWSASIIQTSGCLLFVFNGSLLFLPAAVALLLVGVAELASILEEDVEVHKHPLVSSYTLPILHKGEGELR